MNKTSIDSLKVLLVQDRLTAPGGGERVIYYISNYLNCDIITGKYNPDTTYDFSHTNVTELNGNTFSEFIKSRMTVDWNEYDVAIFSGNRPQFALWRKVDIPTIRYCHSPTRIFWSLRDSEYRDASPSNKLIRHCVAPTYRTLDQYLAHQHDMILTNSHNIRSQVDRFYGVNADVLYPPIDTEQYYYEKSGEFWLSVNRLVPKKRIHEQIEAVKGTSQCLRIVGGIDDQFAEYGNRMRRMAEKIDNVMIEGFVSDKELRERYARCKGVIYVPYFEDFGIVPVEAMASGKPVVAAAEGGPIETVSHGRTGWLISPSAENIRSAVTKSFSPDKYRERAIRQAERFDLQKFHQGICDAISSISER